MNFIYITRYFPMSLISAMLLLAFSLVMAGCVGGGDAQGDEKNISEFRRGKQLLREGRQDMALEAFLKVIAKQERAPEAHFESGRLFLTFINDPVAAIYHFRKYLEYKPDSREAPMIREMIETAQKKFMQQLPGRPMADQIERVDLVNMLQKEREEKQKLYLEIERLKKLIPDDVAVDIPPAQQNNPAFIPQGRNDRPTAPLRVNVGGSNQESNATTASTPAATTQRTYTVQAGDTLSRISTVNYGSSARWNDIYQANRDQLSSPQSLKPGQVLRIP